MAYVKTNWQTGDVVTSSKLNNMETGIYDATEASASAFDPDIDNPQDGDVIKYDSTESKWVNGAAPATFDPDIDDPQNGDVIKYDSTAEKWVNGAGGGGYLKVTIDQNYALDKTWSEIYNAIGAGYFVSLVNQDIDGASFTQITSANSFDGTYTIEDADGNAYDTNSRDGYPVLYVDPDNG